MLAPSRQGGAFVKVLHFYKTYFPDSYGGIEQFIFQLAHGCGDRGVAVDVLSLSPSVDREVGRFDNHGVHRIRRDAEIASTGMSLGALKTFSDLARDADIIHLHYPWPFGDLIHMLASVGKPTVLTYHSDIVRQRLLAKLYHPLMTRFLRSVDSIVATSQNYLESSHTLRSYRHKTRVIPIGLDRATYPSVDAARRERWRSMLGERFLLFVGVLRYYKGLHVLLDALRGAPFSAVIVGAGPIEEELRLHAQRNGLSNVKFLGALSDEDKVALFDLSYVAVFPSHLRAEAFGISLLEAAMFGKPMITSEIGTGTSFINIHGETGLVVPSSDPDALREALRFVYANPDIAQQMGRRALSRFERLFTAGKMVDAHVSLYQDLLSNGAPARDRSERDGSGRIGPSQPHDDGA
jgi:rhamnosyl/mannosyltransferase